jgi:hypothetical protein
MKLLLKPTLLGTLLVTGSSAMASLESAGTQDFGTPTNPINIRGADMPNLTFTKFDTTQGTLDEVLITLIANNSLDSTAINFGDAIAVNTSANATITLSGTGGIVSSSTLQSSLQNTTIGAGSYTSPTFLHSSPSTDVKSGMPPYSVDPSLFSAFEASGGGTLDYSLSPSVAGVSGNPIYTASNISGLIYGFDATTWGSIEIDYEYTPLVAVPESGTMMAGLFALGFGFVAVCRSRARYQS